MVKMKPNDPAYWMLNDRVESVPTVRNVHCYICRDPEFAQMGLPLCYECIVCQAHVPADDNTCDNGHVQPASSVEELMIRREYHLDITPKLFHEAMEVEGFLGVVGIYLHLFDSSWMLRKED